MLGGAGIGKAIIILNPAEPPLLMRNTIFTLTEPASTEAVERSVAAMVEALQGYVPGYRLKQRVQFEELSGVHLPGHGDFAGLKTSVFVEVEGAGDFLPAYAGNLDVMTSAARATAERLAERGVLS